MRTYLIIVKNSFLSTFEYGANFIFYIIRALLRLFVMTTVWTTLYAGLGNVAGVSLQDNISYSVIMTLISALTSVFVSPVIEEEVLSGSIGINLLRPISHMGRLYANSMGQNLYEALSRTVPVLLLSALLLGFRIPANPFYLIPFLVSVCLGTAVRFSIGKK